MPDMMNQGNMQGGAPKADPEAIAQEIASKVEELKSMIPPEVLDNFLKKLSGGQPQEQGPVGPVPMEGGVSGQARM